MFGTGTRVMLDLVDEPDLLDRLAALDEGLADADSRPYVPPPPLVDRLLIPEGEGRWRWNCTTASAPSSIEEPLRHEFDAFDTGLRESSSTADSVFAAQKRTSDSPRTQHLVMPGPLPRLAKRRGFSRTLAAHLAVAMICTAAGAAGAAYVFHDRLVVAMARVEARLR